ncbi:segmentation protein cap'n'collar [Uranotaenia lowii]|uniref:segmentation protein cap'n'collar n=1 Tax=Uranotaenia lowii TaxID=190385 RepID=UPI00247AEF4C|nr:segmentation protein cap'n'collar [Uranotaenia lowii]
MAREIYIGQSLKSITLRDLCFWMHDAWSEIKRTNQTTSVTVDHLLLPSNYESFDHEDLFLNTDPFTDTTSLLEQNIADLNDFGEAPINTYALDTIPLKNEPPPSMFDDFIRMPFDPGFFNPNQNDLNPESPSATAMDEEQPTPSSSTATDCCQNCDARKQLNLAAARGGTEGVAIKQERQDDDCDELTDPGCSGPGSSHRGLASGEIKKEPQEQVDAFLSSSSSTVTIKKEEVEDEEDRKPVTAELTPEEMDLIEVLWKQDVDLGFTLTPPIATSTSGNAIGTAQKSLDKTATNSSEDDLEKLKVLLEIKKDDDKKNDKKEAEVEDPWAGLSYTIDGETGESAFPDRPQAQVSDEGVESTGYRGKSRHRHPNSLPPVFEKGENGLVKRLAQKQQFFGQGTIQGSKCMQISSGSREISSNKRCYRLAAETTHRCGSQTIPSRTIAISGSQMPPECPPSMAHSFKLAVFGPFDVDPSRVPLSRAVSMEQRWQDLANLLSFPPGMGVGMGMGEMAGPAHPHAHHHYAPHHYSYQPTGAIPQHGQYHHPSHAAVLQNASLADIGPTQPHYGPNLGSAVATSMHLTNSTSETDAGATGYKMDHEMMYYSNASSEMNHTDGFLNSILDDDLQLMDIAVNEGMYTMRMLEHNATSSNSSVLGGAGAIGGSAAATVIANSAGAVSMSLNGSSAGGASATGGATGGDRLDASSDSAVSSMGSERVPSLSDGEWGDGGSDSAQEYHNKYGGPFDYSYSASVSRIGDGTRQHPVAQKKHHMFAKRYFQEQNTTIPALAPSNTTSSSSTSVDHQLNSSIPIKYEYDYMPPGSMSHLEGAVGPVVVTKQEDQASAHNPLSSVDMKYPYSLDFARQNPTIPSLPRNHHHDVIHHNHTYTLPHNAGGANPKPQTRDKKIRKAEEEHLTRDEKRARALHIPMSCNDIINLPMDEFNERLSKYDLSETQLSLIRDIRRRGKNKVAAQNCRKRKLDQIVTLADEVKDMKTRKERLLREQDMVLSEKKRIRDKFTALYRHVFHNLRDGDGNPYSQENWSLQQSADGSVVLVPRSVDRQHQHQQQQQQDQLSSAGAGGVSHLHHNQHAGHHHGIQHQLLATGTSNSNHQLPSVVHLHQHQHHQQQHHPSTNGTSSGSAGASGSASSAASNSSNRLKE